MKLLKSGKGLDSVPKLGIYQCIFVDMWDMWHLYEDHYSTFQTKLDHYIAARKVDMNYFNTNYIRRYEHKST